MFGMGGSEIIVILIVALIFLGPDKLPDAAKQLSKGLRDLRKQTRQIQETIENDTQIGGALRDLKSALRGDELRAPFEDMRRQVNQAVTKAGEKPATIAAHTTPETTAADAAPPADATPAGGTEEPPSEHALPVFRPPTHTQAKGAPLTDAPPPPDSDPHDQT